MHRTFCDVHGTSLTNIFNIISVNFANQRSFINIGRSANILQAYCMRYVSKVPVSSEGVRVPGLFRARHPKCDLVTFHGWIDVSVRRIDRS